MGQRKQPRFIDQVAEVVDPDGIIRWLFAAGLVIAGAIGISVAIIPRIIELIRLK